MRPATFGISVEILNMVTTILTKRLSPARHLLGKTFKIKQIIDLQSQCPVSAKHKNEEEKMKLYSSMLYLLLCEYSTSLFKTGLIAKLYN